MATPGARPRGVGSADLRATDIGAAPGPVAAGAGTGGTRGPSRALDSGVDSTDAKGQGADGAVTGLPAGAFGAPARE
ncbi:hypothetical protein ACFVT1_38360 [Streptomyces sp. NPDC057963]|uniref:hypothetical protein n=1 Tax=Streptomyces sp. NPDC057963 TaxID=3346290 RepID=UPI0036ECAED9